MNEWLMNLATTNSIAMITALSAGMWWFVSRSFSHQAQIKNLETKIDHVDQKIDTLFLNLKDSIDKRIDRMDQNHREDIQKMDSKWERLFERLLIQDQQKER